MPEEVPGDGDILFGCAGGAPVQLSGGGELAHSAQVVPGGELFDEGVVVRVRELGQDPVQPGLEVQQVSVDRLQKSVLDEEFSQVHGGARRRVVNGVELAQILDRAGNFIRPVRPTSG